MPWTKLDDQFHSNPKLQALPSDTHRWLYVAALNWSVANLTDGRITLVNVSYLLGKRHGNVVANTVKHLETQGLFDPDTEESDVWWIHDFKQYQPTKSQVEKERKATRERVQKHRDRRKRLDGNGVSNTLRNGVTDGGVTPPRPDPSLSIPLSSPTHTLTDTLNGPRDDDEIVAQETKDEDPPPPTGADPTLWAQALERLHKQEAKGNSTPITHRDLYVGAIYNHLIGEKQQHEANTRAATAITNCTNCDDAGITWTTQDGTPTTRDNPNATTGHQCTHLHAVEPFELSGEWDRSQGGEA